MVPWEPEFADIWMREFYAMWMIEPYENVIEEYKQYPENFGSFIVGINEKEFENLNKTLQNPVDKNDFFQGKTCILYRYNLDFDISDFEGKQVTCAEYMDAQNTRTFEIAAFSDDSYYMGQLMGCPPTIIVSDNTLNQFIPTPFVYKAGIRYAKEYNKKLEDNILKEIETNTYAKDFSFDSKIEEMKELKKAQGNRMEIGMVIVIILAFIGILNYINTVSGNIQSRKVELAVMESVGMTDKQINKMLLLEGALFAGCSIFLTATFGVAITYIIYQSMNYLDIAFSIPVLPMIGMSLFIIAVCVTIPLVIRHAIVKKGSVVERIRGFE